ncbi:hypothetical protein CA54_28110 [Symmachiella macrocystis]|uniref:Uncharacterized protein n=1 Tax=Symmachiella macrocystis TaxID=2527985 RepID=A0A5C6BSV9_9PLAN|nr:hypothetical protein CA54_28110 [Symmachiella macrocystis]
MLNNIVPITRNPGEHVHAIYVVCERPDICHSVPNSPKLVV